MMRLPFKIEAEASLTRARAGRLTTLHGEVETPIFMPVGTCATVKGLRFHELEAAGSRIMLANTYHLLLRPGPEVFERLGGIHKFMNWNGSVLTDSGGFQVFSLPNHVKLDETGARFKSHLDGRTIVLTPESCIGMQKSIGSDIMMVLDQCVPSTSAHAVAKSAMALTHRWAPRCLEARGESRQALFAIVQGACFEDLRRESARVLSDLPFDGFGIGGLAVGETRQEREDIAAIVTDVLPKDRPRYLMGVGTPIDLLEAVHRGVDMFDCILPGALSQQGVAYTRRGRLRLSRGAYRYDNDPIDPQCPCYTCAHHSKAYLHHLTKTREHLGWHLLSLHNISFYHQLMAEMRAHIKTDSFLSFYNAQREALAGGDPDYPVEIETKQRKSSKPPQVKGDYEIVFSPEGFASVRQVSSGEVMHSTSHPDAEARSLYVDQGTLTERLINKSDQQPFVIWDVGLGAGHNAMAAITAFEEAYAKIPLGERRPVQIISFEKDLDSLHLALGYPKYFHHLRHAAPFTLAKEGSWHAPLSPLLWELITGDFLETMHQAPLPHVIFYDPFSAKADSDLWTRMCFAKVRELCGDEPVELYTYSASTAVRATLLATGFFVAKGRSTGQKSETTIALTEAALKERESFWRERLLGSDWLLRWQRSSARHARDVLESERELFERSIGEHLQFRVLEQI